MFVIIQISIILFLTAMLCAEPITNIGSQLELFIDKTLIAKMDNIQLRMHHPHPAEKAFDFNKPWEGCFAGGYVTVIKDNNLYRMYYRGASTAEIDDQVTCLAESKDGIKWKKPDLGLYEWKGIKHNNIVLAGGVLSHNFSPFIDTNPNCKPNERYKALAGIYQKVKNPSVKGLRGLVSPDGIHWKIIKKNPLIPRPKWYAFDSQNVAFWSPAEKKYVCYCRIWVGSKRVKHQYIDGCRWIGRATSNDFLNWSTIKPVKIIHNGKSVPKYHIYVNQTAPYCRNPNIYIALAVRFMEGRQVITDEQAKEIKVNPKYYKDCSDVVLLTARAGTNVYNQTFLSSFIRPGIGAESWISRTNYPALNIVQTGDHEMSIYISQNYAQPTSHIRQYTLRIDGFASLHADFEYGSVITKPIRFEGSKLKLNFWTSAAGSIRVELQDKSGNPIEGYSLDDCPEIIGNEISRPVYWKHGTDVSKLAGRVIRIMFELKDADLYSFQFTN